MFADLKKKFIIFFVDFKDNCLVFRASIIPFPVVILGPIGSAVVTFIGYKQTNRQAKYIYR